MCEETKNYLWATQDILGHGATSQVYKAYNKVTGELVAAKVYQVAPNQRGVYQNQPRERDFRPILDREMEILKATNHENIVRYIALEPVTSSDTPGVVPNTREALLLEYCNGGSLHNVLELPENRYGLSEDDFMLLFRHLTNALKYLHDKNTIHRDIKPDNIMLSININGERTYKLADLGVARLMNEGEQAFTSLVGTEEYIHPKLYEAAIPDNRTQVLRSTLQARVEFPFEVDLWSLGVTLYQCATGELPFQPFAGTRKDRTVMKRILRTKPSGHISGMETTQGGEIQWSRTLPDSCRLSSSLKARIENLLQRLLESDPAKLMTFNEFFRQTDFILNLKPIYYLNLKRFQLTCAYFEPTQSITKLYDELRIQNGDKNNEEYYCLFQNVPYPINKSNPLSIKDFCDRLPLATSRETPLVFYTFSSFKSNNNYSPTIHLPTVKPIRQYNDVAAAFEWSKDMVGFFFYVKLQLIEYQNILQTAQCSTTIMQQHLKGKLLEFLCVIRSRLINFRAIEELKNILDQLESSANGSMPSGNASPALPPRSSASSNGGGDAPSIGFSHLYNNSASAENSVSSPAIQRPSSTSSMQLIQQSTRNYLRSYVQPYEQLKTCEKDIMHMIEKEFGGQLSMIDDKQPYLNTLWSSNRSKNYLTWIQQAEKHLKDLNELHESFRKDRLLSAYNRLQSDSHFRRRTNLEELHKKYIDFANEKCYPELLQIFQDYNEWIKKRSNMINDFERIQESYEKQCEDIMNYMDMIDNLRTVVQRNIQELGSSSSSSSVAMMRSASSSEQLFPSTTAPAPAPPVPVRPERMQRSEISGSNSQLSTTDNSTSRNFMSALHGTTKKTIQNAEKSLDQLESVIRQLRITSRKK